MKRRGFTLFDLVVVLGCMLAVAAIIFPFFAKSTHHPPRSPCQQNIRQIGLAIKQYLNDSDESFPLVEGAKSPYGWADAVQPYMRDMQLFQCPSESTHPPTPPATMVMGSDPLYTDYFYNSHLASLHESSLQYIANTVMLGDAVSGNARLHSTGGTSKIPGAARLVDSSGVPVGAATCHLGGANYGFADGHVKWLKGRNAMTCPAIKNAASGSGSAYPGFGVQ